MARVPQWMWVLLLLGEALISASAPTGAPCNSTTRVAGARLHIHLSSHVNATGHRVLAAQVQSAGEPDQRVELDVTQRESNLNADAGGGHLLTLDTEAAVEARAGSAERAAEALDVNRVRKGAVPDGDFEEVPYADYRPLDSTNASVKGLYKVHARARTWPEARAACEAEYAHLLVAETAAEAAAAARTFARSPAPTAAQRADLFFVGLSDEQREGHYVTVTGKNLTSLEYQSWHAKEPSKGREQNYVALDKEGNLHDIPNSWKLAFICEALPI